MGEDYANAILASIRRGAGGSHASNRLSLLCSWDSEIGKGRGGGQGGGVFLLEAQFTKWEVTTVVPFNGATHLLVQGGNQLRTLYR